MATRMHAPAEIAPLLEAKFAFRRQDANYARWFVSGGPLCITDADITTWLAEQGYPQTVQWSWRDDGTIAVESP